MTPEHHSGSSRQQWLVAIGASAGGPQALAALLRPLPKTFPAAIVIVQHVNAAFADGLAHWLDSETALPVRLVREGDRPMPGEVLIAATDDHLIVTRGGRLAYTSDPIEYPYRPSADVFFHSACACWPGSIVGVLLSGMGRDGALGLKALRDAGHYTIAQDAATSAVYGMPKAAATLDAAVEILAAQAIGPRVMALVGCEVER
jgi:two-component system, chemotaxis family, response regulator WspF